jgi:hypothetical protein
MGGPWRQLIRIRKLVRRSSHVFIDEGRRLGLVTTGRLMPPKKATERLSRPVNYFQFSVAVSGFFCERA